MNILPKKIFKKSIIILAAILVLSSACVFALADEDTQVQTPEDQQLTAGDDEYIQTGDASYTGKNVRVVHHFLHVDTAGWMDDGKAAFAVVGLLLVITWILLARLKRKVKTLIKLNKSEKGLTEERINKLIDARLKSSPSKSTIEDMTAEELTALISTKVDQALSGQTAATKNNGRVKNGAKHSEKENNTAAVSNRIEDEAIKNFMSNERISAVFRVYGYDNSVEVEQVLSDNEETADLFLYKSEDGLEYYTIINNKQQKKMSRNIYKKGHFDYLFDAEFPEVSADDYQFDYFIPQGKYAVCVKKEDKDTFIEKKRGVIEIINNNEHIN